MARKRSCHCGRIAFEGEGTFRCLEGIDIATLERVPFDGRRA